MRDVKKPGKGKSTTPTSEKTAARKPKKTVRFRDLNSMKNPSNIRGGVARYLAMTTNW